jgi:hypothetical protein
MLDFCIVPLGSDGEVVVMELYRRWEEIFCDNLVFGFGKGKSLEIPNTKS